MIEIGIFAVVAVVGIWLLIKVVKLAVRLAILAALAIAFYYFVYPHLERFI